MSGAWDDMLAHEQAERERAEGISSQAGLAALRAGARRAGLEHGQAAPDREACTCVDHLPPLGMPFPACPIHWPTDRENGSES